MLTVSIPDEIDLQLSSVTNDKKKFIIAAIRQKIALQKKTLFPEQLAQEYSDSRIENNQITKDFANTDKENWNDY